MTATLLLLPGGVALAGQVDGAAETSPTYLVSDAGATRTLQADMERRCIIRCNDPERPPPGARLREAATKARTVVQDAREELREEVQEARQDVREATQDVREDLREGAGRVREAVGEVKEGAGEVKEALAEPSPTSEAAPSEAAQQAPPAQTTAPDIQASAPQPPSGATDPAATAIMSAAPAAVAASAPPAALDPGSEVAARSADGVAGGPSASTQRPESGTFGQGKGPESSAIAAPAPAVAATPPATESEAPVAVQAPPAAPVVDAAPVDPPASTADQNPPSSAEQPDDSSASSTASTSSPDELAKWSVPLAVAGAVLAGLALVFPMARRPQPILGAAQTNDRSSARQAETWPSARRQTVRPIRDSVVTAPGARLNGSPVPYLNPVRAGGGQAEFDADASYRASRAHSTNVAGLSWSDPELNDPAERALA